MFDITDFDDIIEKFDSLLEDHKNYDSKELIEHSESFEENFEEILKEARSFTYDAVSEFEEMEEKIDHLKIDLENVEDSILSYGNMHGLMKRRICIDLFNNLNLSELEELEKSIIENKKIYYISTLSEVE